MEASSDFGAIDPHLSLREALDRTLRLMRDEVGELPGDGELLDALTSTRIAVVADEANIASPAAQTAFITTATLAARSGHQVYVRAPDLLMSAPQPPLRPGNLISELMSLGRDLLPGATIELLRDDQELDLIVVLGSSPAPRNSRRTIRLNAEAWSGSIVPENQPALWNEETWPIGALVAAALAAGEAFKIAVMKLRQHFLNPSRTIAIFAPIRTFTYIAAPADTPCVPALGNIDFISGGAISTSALYTLARLPNVRAHGRIIEPDVAAMSNLNRYPLLVRSKLGNEKARDLADTLSGSGLVFTPILMRYEPTALASFGNLAATTIVGADDIPTRWLAQQAQPDFLVIGATTHWSAMASFHAVGLGCAQCLHTEDDLIDALIPTTACVSFWAGLLVAIYLLQQRAGCIAHADQQVFLTPFRPERPFRAKVPIWKDCPTCHGHGAGLVEPIIA